MKCLNDEIIFRYANNLLDGQEKDSVSNHVKVCEACSKTLKEETVFDNTLKISLKKNHRVADFARSVLKLSREKKEITPNVFRNILVAGSIMWTMAVFNSITAFILILIHFDYSMGKMMIATKDLIFSLIKAISIYAVYLSVISGTLYVCIFLMFSIFLILNFTVLKTSKLSA